MPKIDEDFKVFLEDFSAGKYSSPLQIPHPIWGSPAWDMLDKRQINEIFLPLLRFQIDRARKMMPFIYGSAYEKKGISELKLNSIEDFWNVPMLVKDSSTLNVGFRQKIKDDPYVLLPNDVDGSVFVYKSGGTKGMATPTFITMADREIETHSLKKCFEYMGIKKSDVSLSTYNPTHKGGQWIQESLTKLGSRFIPRRTTDNSEETIQTIKNYNVNILATVQGPVADGDQTTKGGGVDFMSLVAAGQDVLEEKLETLFITGYILIPEVIAWAEAHGKNLATTLGSSEAIAQATSTVGPKDRLCKYNNLHILNGPHYVEVVKEESGVLVPAKQGEEGILVYTTVAREGTIYIRYAPGDSAKIIASEGACSCGLRSQLITDILRIDTPTDVIAAGCCIG